MLAVRLSRLQNLSPDPAFTKEGELDFESSHAAATRRRMADRRRHVASALCQVVFCSLKRLAWRSGSKARISIREIATKVTSPDPVRPCSRTVLAHVHFALNKFRALSLEPSYCRPRGVTPALLIF